MSHRADEPECWGGFGMLRHGHAFTNKCLTCFDMVMASLENGVVVYVFTVS